MPSPEASRKNLEKGRANWRPPRHCLAPEQRELIQCVVWWWSTCKGEKPSERAVARHIGVSYTYLQSIRKKLAKIPCERPPSLTFNQALSKLESLRFSPDHN
jgi:hypothetical protein